MAKSQPELVLTLGPAVTKVPGGDSVIILRNGIVTETRSILKEESMR